MYIPLKGINTIVLLKNKIKPPFWPARALPMATKTGVSSFGKVRMLELRFEICQYLCAPYSYMIKFLLNT